MEVSIKRLPNVKNIALLAFSDDIIMALLLFLHFGGAGSKTEQDSPSVRWSNSRGGDGPRRLKR